MLKYSIPLIATVIGWWINSTADKYVVVFMLGTAANGLLSVSYKIPQILNTFQGIFTQAWQISAIKEYGEDDTSTFYGKTFSKITGEDGSIIYTQEVFIYSIKKDDFETPIL